MIDPKTLKVGDIVTFGGKVELTVESVSYYHIYWKNVIRASYFEDPFWKISELKKPKLPGSVSGFTLNEQGRYRSDLGFYYSPLEVLQSLKAGVFMLEAAGVKETE